MDSELSIKEGNPEVYPNICDKIGFNTWRDSISRSLFRLFAVLSSVILPLHRASEKKYFIMLENFYHAVTFLSRFYKVYKVMIMKVGRGCTNCAKNTEDLHRGCTRIGGMHRHVSLRQERPGWWCPLGSLHFCPGHKVFRLPLSLMVIAMISPF